MIYLSLIVFFKSLKIALQNDHQQVCDRAMQSELHANQMADRLALLQMELRDKEAELHRVNQVRSRHVTINPYLFVSVRGTHIYSFFSFLLTNAFQSLKQNLSKSHAMCDDLNRQVAELQSEIRVLQSSQSELRQSAQLEGTEAAALKTQIRLIVQQLESCMESNDALKTRVEDDATKLQEIKAKVLSFFFFLFFKPAIGARYYLSRFFFFIISVQVVDMIQISPH